MKAFLLHIENLKSHPRKDNLLWVLTDAAAAFIGLCGVTTLYGYFADVNKFYTGWVNDSPPMAIQSALCFTFAGFALLTMHRKPL